MRHAVLLFPLLFLLGFRVAGASLADLPPYVPDATAPRSDIPDVYTWRLQDLYPSDTAWKEAFSAARRDVSSLSKLHDRLGDAAVLAEYLGAYYDVELRIHRLTLYANLQRDVDTTNQEFIARHQMALGLTDAVMNEGTVLRRAVLAVPVEDLEEAYDEIPELRRFQPAIDELRRRADRVLVPEAERVLALAGDNLWAAIDLNELPSAIERAHGAVLSELPMPSITDHEGREVQLTLANYPRYRASGDRRVRREAEESFFARLEDFQNTFAATLAGQAELNVFMARARKYPTALEAYLDKDDLDPEVYHTLIDTVRDHAPALHRYVELRRRVMGLDEVRIYDLYVPMVEGVERTIPYIEGAETILSSVEALGRDYLEGVRWMVDPTNGAIDVYPSLRKDSGAFSTSVYGVHPYIKMNYQDRYDDMSTLTHELGHALHSKLSNEAQPYLTSKYPPFLAEVASTCNEMLLSRHLVARASSDAERAWLLSELVEAIRTTIYRQTMFAEFELAVHGLVEAGEAVTADRLNQLYESLLRDYYGPGFTIGPHDAIEWAYIPHFYYKYYVFTYATGMASGIAIAERLAEGVPGTVDGYMAMLRGGSSKPPLDLLAGAGVDLTKPDAIAAALELFDRTVTQLEKLLIK